MNFHRIAAGRSARVGAGLAVIAAVAAAGISAAPASVAAPIAVPTPAAPKVLFAENFQHASVGTVVGIKNYVGSGGMTYGADTDWTTHCNGDIISGNATAAQLAAPPMNNCDKSGSPDTAAFDSLKDEAIALGQNAGLTGAAAQGNYALSAYTEANPTPGIQMQTLKPINLPAGGRYIALSVDGAAANCASQGATPPGYQFLAGPFGGTLSPVGAALQGCTGRTLTINNNNIMVNSYESSEAALITSGELTTALKNTVATGWGNDGAVDNFRVLDVTPTLSKAFSST